MKELRFADDETLRRGNRLLVKNETVDNCCLQEYPDCHFPPSLDSSSEETVIHSMLICQVNAVHVFVVTANHLWLDCWIVCGGK